MTDFRTVLTERVLILDGAMGALLEERGLQPGDCPEEMNRTAPQIVTAIHAEYAAAGADILVANSSGSNRARLAHYGLEAAVDELNRRAVELVRKACGDHVFIGGCVGSTGRFVESAGAVGFDEMVDIFAEQISALAGAGVDLITFEPFLDMRELRAGIIASRAVCDLPVIARAAFDATSHAPLGTSPTAAVVTLDALQVDVIGTSCGLGIDGSHDLLVQMRQGTSRPLISQTTLPDTPEGMIADHERLIALGVRIIGGCGTTPDHVRAMSTALGSCSKSWTPPVRRGLLASRSAVVEFGGEAPCILIGERINPTGKKGYTEELLSAKTDFIRSEATAQMVAGAHLLDINCGAPGVDEAAALERAVLAATDACTVPLVIDTTDVSALERVLKAVDGKVLINSVTGEARSLERILPLACRYGAAVIGLALDETGIPETAEGRVEIARRILNAALDQGLPQQDLVIDCLTLPVAAEPQQALETLRTLRLVRDELGLTTVLGVSNISFGLPSRQVLSSVFFAMAMEAGLKMAIINPKDARMMDTYRSARALLCQDVRAEDYIAHYAPPSASVSCT